MKRDFLKGLGLSDEQIESIMSENGKDIESVKAKFSDYDDIKKQLETANETIEKFKDYDQTKADAEKYKAELKKLQDESSAKITQMERHAKVKDFTSSKKFVNDFTKDSINSLLEKALSEDSSKGKSLDDLFAEIIKDKSNIFVDENTPKPPVVQNMKGSDKDNSKSAINVARTVMGLPPKD